MFSFCAWACLYHDRAGSSRPVRLLVALELYIAHERAQRLLVDRGVGSRVEPVVVLPVGPNVCRPTALQPVWHGLDNVAGDVPVCRACVTVQPTRLVVTLTDAFVVAGAWRRRRDPRDPRDVGAWNVDGPRLAAIVNSVAYLRRRRQDRRAVLEPRPIKRHVALGAERLRSQRSVRRGQGGGRDERVLPEGAAHKPQRHSRIWHLHLRAAACDGGCCCR